MPMTISNFMFIMFAVWSAFAYANSDMIMFGISLVFLGLGTFLAIYYDSKYR